MAEKFNYLMVTRPNTSYAVSFISQFLLAPKTNHISARVRILKYLKKSTQMIVLFRWWTYSSIKLFRWTLVAYLFL